MAGSIYLQRIDTSLIYPPFIKIVEPALEYLATEKKNPMYALGDGGYRDEAAQTKLYLQGRRTPGKIVTNARWLQSAHNYGIALDLCADADANKAGLQPDWTDPPYKVMAAEMTMRGLEAAYFWKNFREGPHIQLPLDEKHINLWDPTEFRGEPCLRDIYLKGGIKAVWALLDKYAW